MNLLLGKSREKSDLVHNKSRNIRIDTASIVGKASGKTEEKFYLVGPLKLLVKYYTKKISTSRISDNTSVKIILPD